MNEQPRLVSLCAGDSIVLKSVGDPSRTLFQAGRGAGPDVAVRLDFCHFKQTLASYDGLGSPEAMLHFPASASNANSYSLVN
jgi:hypothetical protein